MITPKARKRLNTMYAEALEDLHFFVPKWAPLVEGLGLPVYSTENPTAWVKYANKDKQIMFCINPEFMETLNSDTLAAVMLHEAHHVFREDLEDMLDRATYPNPQDLVKAQECTINDSIEKTHNLELPEFVMRGEALAGVDMSMMSVLEAYEIFNNDEEADNTDESDENQDEDSSGAGGAGGASNGGGTPNSGDDNDGDNESKSEEYEDSDETKNSDSTDGQDNEDGDESNSGQDDTEDEDQGNADGGDDSEDDDSDGEDKTNGYHATGGACGGIIMDEDDLDGFQEAVGDIIDAVAYGMGISTQDLMDRVNNTASKGFSPTGAAPSIEDQLTAAEAKWRELLIEINPKVKSAGGRPRRKSKNNWTAYNRSMASVYPKVILPKVEALNPKNPDDKGDDAPTFIVALDLSGSIDRSLVNTLKAWIEQIPTDLIRAFPVTWSDNVVPYNEENRFRLVGAGGTNIHNVSKYAAEVERETGVKPYVLVITDGEHDANFKRDTAKEWIWMGIHRGDANRIKNGGGWYGAAVAKSDEKVYDMKDFM